MKAGLKIIKYGNTSDFTFHDRARLRKDRLLNGQARETVRQSGQVEERKSQETARGRSSVIFKAQNAQL